MVKTTPSSSFREKWAWLCENLSEGEIKIKAVYEQAGVNCLMVAVNFLNMVEDYIAILIINTDAYVLDGVLVGLGAMIQDSAGCLRAVGVKRIWPTSTTIAEAQVARYGVSVALRLGFDRVILECDSYNMVHAIMTKARGFSPIHGIYEDIANDILQFSFFDCTHTKRSGNTVAHMIARLDVNVCNEYVCMGPFPQSIVTLAELDFS
ncbi:Histidine biosynthesis bifunctional protein HisB [Bienertia sinuspersici]